MEGNHETRAADLRFHPGRRRRSGRRLLVRQVGQIAFHGHAARAEVRGRGGRRRHRDHRSPRRAEPRRAHGGGDGGIGRAPHRGCGQRCVERARGVRRAGALRGLCREAACARPARPRRQGPGAGRASGARLGGGAGGISPAATCLKRHRPHSGCAQPAAVARHERGADRPAGKNRRASDAHHALRAAQRRHRGARPARRHDGDVRCDAVSSRRSFERVGQRRSARGAGRVAAPWNGGRSARAELPRPGLPRAGERDPARGECGDAYAARAGRARQSGRKAEARHVRDASLRARDGNEGAPRSVGSGHPHRRAQRRHRGRERRQIPAAGSRARLRVGRQERNPQGTLRRRQGRRLRPVPHRLRGELEGERYAHGRRGGGEGGRERARVRSAQMIAKLIRWSIANRFLVLLATVAFAAWGIWAASRTPLDAIPDLSDVQVIIRTTYPGQAPQIVENQITYPLTTTMLSVPGAKTVRGYSFFGDSFVYVLFEDGTDPYWARSRVLEYLNQVQSRLPPQAKTSLGPDATGVGWVYEYALVDRSGRMDLSQLRALQDWFLKYELKAVTNVSEVASVGGMVKQYQIVLDPVRLRAFNIPQAKVIEAVQRGNQETGGSVLELGEAEYMVRASGYLQSLDDFRKVPLTTTDAGVSVRLGDVARVQLGPEMRRGIGELDGEGEAAGGVIVMRSGKNALETIAAVKDKLKELQGSLPKGVEIVPTYDRSGLIERAVDNLTHKLVEEFVVVALVCVLFLFHLRSAFVAIVSLPLGILAAFIVMYYQGVNANIMSLGGIAIAIGAMVDAAVVMIENAHKRLEAWHHVHPGGTLAGEERWGVIGEAAAQVGPALFISLLIITFSFVPVFTLEAQEGRLFSPLAFTKTYAMAAAAGLAVTLIPVLMVYVIRRRSPAEGPNPINPLLIASSCPLHERALRSRKTVLLVAAS